MEYQWRGRRKYPHGVKSPFACRSGGKPYELRLNSLKGVVIGDYIGDYYQGD